MVVGSPYRLASQSFPHFNPADISKELKPRKWFLTSMNLQNSEIGVRIHVKVSSHWNKTTLGNDTNSKKFMTLPSIVDHRKLWKTIDSNMRATKILIIFVCNILVNFEPLQAQITGLNPQITRKRPSELSYFPSLKHIKLLKSFLRWLNK